MEFYMSEYYDKLIANAKDLFCSCSEEELYIMGKDLDYNERVRFYDYIRCIKEKKDFHQTFSIYNCGDIVLNELIKHDELKYIIENISKIMKPSSNLKHELLTYLKQKINCISEDDLLKIEYAIANTLCNCINNRDEVVSKIRNLLIDVATSEKVSLLDIRKIDYGAYSQIYRLGEKVIKIGLNRAVENIIDNRLILIPDYKGFIGSEYIEITDYIEIDNEGVTFNDLYMMYEELREQGITWLDPSEENVTRVDQKTLDKIKKKDKKKLGFDTNLNYNNKELVVGDLIIIDLDHLISTNDINMIKHIKYNLNEIIVEKLDYFEKIYNERHKTKCLTLKNVRI